MATKEVMQSEGIVPHRGAKGVDITGDTETNIIRSDLGCFMRVDHFREGHKATIFPLHPTCANGDHYFSLYKSPDVGADYAVHFVMKGNSCRQVEDLSTDAAAIEFNVHKDCQYGDFYMATSKYHSFSTSYIFIIVFAKDWTFKVVSDLHTAKSSSEYKKLYPHAAKNDGPYNLHYNCRGGLYYWATKGYYGTMRYHIIKGVNEWGVQIHHTKDLNTDEEGSDETISPSITNFLPGGLSVNMGVPTGQWHIIKSIINEHSDSPLEWSDEVSKRIGHKKNLASSMMMNWNITTKFSEEITAGLTLEKIATASSKTEFSVTTSFGGEIKMSSQEDWEEEKTVKEKLELTVKPKSNMYIWQYIKGFRKQDAFQEVLFSPHLLVTDTAATPTHVPASL